MNETKAKQRKQQILQAASLLVAHYGVDKTRMEDIAREAGVSKGALYLEWSSKDDLLDALILYETKRLLLDFQRRMGADPLGGQIGNLYSHALFALKDNPLMRAMYTQDTHVLGDYVKRQGSEHYTRRIMLSQEAVRQMQAADLLRKDLRPEVINYLFGIIAVGFIYIGTLISPDNQPAIDEISAALMDVMQRGFAGPGDDSAAGKQAIARLTDFVLAQYDEQQAQ